ncbi:MAG: hypothetical protein K1X64_20775 [Myxococcaceae bacterium]|nr:hypothetical protein [Myxococcaceae bacterium]
MNTKILVGILSAFFIAACGNPGLSVSSEQLPENGPTQDLRNAPKVTSSVKVALSQNAPVQFASKFKLGTTYDLYFAMDITHLPAGAHHVDIELTAPGGIVYQSLPVDFVVADAGKTTRVWAALPVAGTLIEQMNLVGQWKAAGFINYGGSASSSSTFNLK